MTLKNRYRPLLTTIIFIFCITGCEKGEPYSVKIPSLPIILSAVVDMVPMNNGKRYDIIMPYVCAMARNEKSLSDVASELKSKDIDISGVPESGQSLSILIAKNNDVRAAACAAYLATEIYKIPQRNEFLAEIERQGKSKIAAETEPTDRKEFEINKNSFSSMLRKNMSIAIANSEIYSLIAIKMEHHDNLPPALYRQEAKDLFYKLSAYYLIRIKELYSYETNTNYELLDYTDKTIRFSNEHGFVFDNGPSGFSLTFNQAPWLKDGKLLGNTYRVKSMFFDKRWVDAIKD